MNLSKFFLKNRNLFILGGLLIILLSIPFSVRLTQQEHKAYEIGKKAAEAFAEPLTKAGAKILYFPLYIKKWHNQTSALQVQNVGEEETEVTATFYNVWGTKKGEERLTIKPQGFYQFYAPSLTSLPNDFLGTAILESNKENIVAMVNTCYYTRYEGDAPDIESKILAYTYGGFTPKEVAKTLYLPLYIKKWHNQTSATQIQNVGEGETQITITFYDTEGREMGKEQAIISPYGFKQFYAPTDTPSLPNNFLGTAKIESDKENIVAMVNTCYYTRYEGDAPDIESKILAYTYKGFPALPTEEAVCNLNLLKVWFQQQEKELGKGHKGAVIFYLKKDNEVVFEKTITLDENGEAKDISLIGVSPATYDAFVYEPGYLAKKLSDVEIKEGGNTIDFTRGETEYFLIGDFNGDGEANILDFSVFVSSYGKKGED